MSARQEVVKRKIVIPPRVVLTEEGEGQRKKKGLKSDRGSPRPGWSEKGRGSLLGS